MGEFGRFRFINKLFFHSYLFETVCSPSSCPNRDNDGFFFFSGGDIFWYFDWNLLEKRYLVVVRCEEQK